MQCLDSVCFWSVAKPFMSSAMWRNLGSCAASLALCADLAVLNEHLSAIRSGAISIGAPLPAMPAVPARWRACLWHNFRTLLRSQGMERNDAPLRWLYDWALRASMARADVAIHAYSPIASELVVDDPNNLYPAARRSL